MSRRKNWSPNEDMVLKILREERGLKKWSEIAKIMEQEFAITERTGKQCRERYHNHLDSSITLEEWSTQEEEILFAMHEDLGNKWSQISQKLPGRSDNCIKNHFYSKLRKTVRKLNRVIQESGLSGWREIKLPLLNKVIETAEEHFKSSSKLQEETIEKCIQIVNRLFCFDHLQCSSSKQQETYIRWLIDDLMSVEHKLRRCWKGTKDPKEMQTALESRQVQKPSKSSQSSQSSQGREQPFYQIFKRVCDQIMHNNN